MATVTGKKDQDGAKMGQEGAKMDSRQARMDHHEAKKRGTEDLLKCGRSRQVWDFVQVWVVEDMVDGC